MLFYCYVITVTYVYMPKNTYIILYVYINHLTQIKVIYAYTQGSNSHADFSTNEPSRPGR